MKTLNIIAIVSLALFAAVGCRTKHTLPIFDVVMTDTLLNNGNVELKVQYEFTTIANAASAPALQAIEATNIGYFFSLEEFQGTAKEAAQEAIRELVAENSALSPDMQSSLQDAFVTITSEAVVVDSILVYTISYANFTGGAHGIQGVNTHNYSLRGGYELSLNDLFGAEQQQALAALIRTKLYEQFHVASDEGLVEQGFFPEYINVTNNFAITDDGIVFYYNPYDIGCYALGGVEVAVSGEELAAL